MSFKMSSSNRFPRRSRGDFEIAGLYDLEETIGKGHFAVVKLARHVFTNEKVAVKVIDKTKLDDISKSHLFQEVRCMKLVQHPNVVRLYEVIDTQTKLYLILELGDGGDMYDYIMKHEKGLPEDKARRYFRQIVEAISYCHKLHVVHRDLKPENVVFFEKLGIVKLTDFGFSNMFNPGKKLETSCGSLAYSAPEILLGDSYDAPAVDVWSLGVILYMLVCGEPPFQEANDSETLTMIMDCKYLIPDHISSACKDLIHKMLQRDPAHRARLNDILNHQWLCTGDYMAPTVPLISREHLSEEDHNYLIEKMVEGSIATKDEILGSLDKDLYDHITATYYLLAERKLKRHHQEMALAHIRKHSAKPENSPVHSIKPSLELSLSPRNTEAKKTRTAPLFNQTALDIPVSPPPGESRNDFMKSLTTSMTLDRKAVNKSNLKTDRSGSLTGAEPNPVLQLSAQRSGSVSPQTGIRRFLPSLGTIPDTVLTGSRSSTDLDKISQSNGKKKGFAPISKIQILKSFFERKVAQLSGKPTTPDRLTGLFKPPKSSKEKLARPRVVPTINILDTDAPDSNVRPGKSKLGKSKKSKTKTDGVQSKETKEEQLRRPKTSIVQSLVSPPGTHPTSSATPDSRGMRKYSLIQEESLDDEDDEELMEVDPADIRPAKSVESLDDGITWKGPGQSLPSFEPLQMKRPLVSVASSPQLLNQICEENETDVEEEDDFVPNKLHSPRMRISRGSCASPEVLRKYEQRKKRSGSKVTSCSSSDASDTDDTEKRSRKDKLKPKFMHRRDSSDHSSDTDGGPSGPSTGGLGGGRASAGGGGKERGNKDRKGGGGSKGHKEGKSGGGGGKQHTHSCRSRSGESSISSAISNLSMSSINSKNSLKYIVEGDESNDSDVEDNDMKTDDKEEVRERNYIDKVCDKENKICEEVISLCSSDCSGHHHDKKVYGNRLKIKVDINRNSFCKVQESSLHPIKIQTKCCSLV
ncbi:serine/threonine-protein kinase MARK2-like isoform X2 [Saccostrea echinata]|uniref:serine/threonine-protein kinase MARK2-like isoform X2 n=1 Tax=Saccostrea echinata TaxID=191078 RepID=UPI002A7EFB66|nr:serine/threonine-protein kinase MARK2-like isoform X2 [Saccostrea echinata]